MLNPFKIKKWGALSLMGFMPAVTFAIMALYYGYWGGLISMFVVLLVVMPLCNLMLKNPFTDMLEGKGILAFDINSTGIIKPFIVALDPPYLHGQVNKREVKDVYDRENTFSLQTPVNFIKSKLKGQKRKDGGVKMPQLKDLDAEAYNYAKFGLNHYPVLIFNSAIDSFMTKQTLSSLEKDTFAEQTIIFLNKRVENLTSHIVNFGRAVVEEFNPGWGNILRNPLVWVGIIILIGLLVVMFIPGISSAMGNFFGTASESVGSVAGQNADKVVNPKGG